MRKYSASQLLVTCKQPVRIDFEPDYNIIWLHNYYDRENSITSFRWKRKISRCFEICGRFPSTLPINSLRKGESVAQHSLEKPIKTTSLRPSYTSVN